MKSKLLAILIVTAALLITAPTGSAGSFQPGYNLDPGGGYALPTCGSNDYYTFYNWNHEVWTCLFGSWYYGGSW